jgi:hypothetical protein
MAFRIAITRDVDRDGKVVFRVIVLVDGTPRPPRFFQSRDDAERFANGERLRFLEAPMPRGPEA